MSKESEDSKERILQDVRDFNALVKSGIDGPNCIDPAVCDGNCCFIQIDIPRCLAELYVEKGWAKPSDFQRAATFSFEIRADLSTLRCVFFDKELNGCSIHMTGMKTPQCWVYPTGLDPGTAKSTCKKAEGWRITKPEEIRKANSILTEYVKKCKAEARDENSDKTIRKRLKNVLRNEFQNLPPRSVAGITDGWDEFHVLQGEGYNLGLRAFCRGTSCGQEYLTCAKMCENVIDQILGFLDETLPKYVQTVGFKKEYLFFELNSFDSNQNA